MYILSLQLGHNATAALLKDGQIIGIVSQERFDYLKNSNAFPHDAISYLFSLVGINGQDLDAVSIAGLNVFPSQMSDLSTNKKSSKMLEVWTYLNYKFPNLANVFRIFVLNHFKHLKVEHAKNRLFDLLKKYNIPKEKVYFVEHHITHAYTPLYGFIKNKHKWSIVTLDGSGDFYSATVNVFDGKKIERISSTPIHSSLGYMYSKTTQFLGMKALEHEYKVMGLAPYVKKKYGDFVYERYFKDLINISDNLTFKSRIPMPYFDYYLKEYVCGQRFDNVAYALQRKIEELIINWIDKVINHTNIPYIATSGGVFMNVKANMRLAYLERIKDIFFTPSAGDESNPIGAAYYTYIKLGGKHFNPITNLYLGPSFSNDYIGEFIKKNDLKGKYKIDYYKDIEGVIGELIAKGEVVARFSGRAEWGARALGNRSILADPSKMESFFKVNDQIKMRDFWMPFAPTILSERAHEYIVNPLNRKAPYMIVAFRSTEEGRKYFKAAMHQGDHTLRPQILERSWNPKYYKIIKEFENITGIGGVLNTSFNLHGKPIATFPWQAIDVFENSNLKYLALENWLIKKK